MEVGPDILMNRRCSNWRKALNKKWQIALLPLLILCVGLVISCSGAIEAKDGDTVKVDYRLTLEDGTIYDETVEGEPIEFTLGKNMVIAGFEEAIKGMKVGESKTITLTPEEAYGQYDDSLIEVVDRSELPADIEPEVGQTLVRQDSDGTVSTFMVTAVYDDTITVDGNHSLAGETLTFEIKLLEITAGE